MKRVSVCGVLALMLACGLSSVARAKGPFLLVSGRWDNTVVVIDVE
jgi:hypothetical protein